uniref:Uncharacterized protein n=1 Tax=Anguilla anguilla TaxID=7936 RepID=A0A0E9VVT9_ANGAN
MTYPRRRISVFHLAVQSTLCDKV